MSKTIVENWNAVINDEDYVYVLGDLMLSDDELGIEFIKSLK